MRGLWNVRHPLAAAALHLLGLSLAQLNSCININTNILRRKPNFFTLTHQDTALLRINTQTWQQNPPQTSKWAPRPQHQRQPQATPNPNTEATHASRLSSRYGLLCLPMLPRHLLTGSQFVQSLANPYYLNHLASQKLLTQPAFVAYLAYLQYWSKPPYLKYLTFPGPTLRHLELLQQPKFREHIMSPHTVQQLVDGDMQAAMEWHREA